MKGNSPAWDALTLGKFVQSSSFQPFSICRPKKRNRLKPPDNRFAFLSYLS